MGRVLGVRAWAGLVPCLALLASCGSGGSEKRRVAASIFPLYDIARRVAGDRVQVDLVLPPGQTDHSFDPRPKDVAALAEASLVFAVGLGLDPWLESLVKSAGGGRARLFELGPLVDPILVPEHIVRTSEGEGAPSGPGVIDPHFWLDPVRMQRATDLMVEALRNLDPEEGPGYQARGDEVKRQLARLHDETTERSRSWRHRAIVTFHGAFFYFADRYRLQVVAVIEPVPGREPTASYLADIIELIRRSDAAAIFSEPQLERGLAQTVAKEVGLPLLELDPLGGGPRADSYEKMMRRNVDVLEQVLR